ncbi:MAG: PepSY domain-containing protein [Armatimonadota bacterium]
MICRAILRGMVVVAMTLLCFASAQNNLVPYNPNTMNFPISPEQAVEAARVWAKNPMLDVSVVGVKSFPDYDKDFYELATPGGTERYSVNCQTGKVEVWVDLAGEAEYTQKKDALDPADMLSTAELNSLVEQFLSDHYPEFEALNLQHLNPDTPSSGYAQRLVNEYGI